MREARTYPSHHTSTCRSKAKARRGSHDFKRGKYKRQWDKTTRNRKRKLQKHLALRPGDIQALAALKKLL